MKISAPAFSPMLARTASKPFDDPDWFFEVKWDGYRLIVWVERARTTLISRNGIDVSETYPEIRDAFSTMETSAVFDGELVALDKEGRPRFQMLQSARRATSALIYYAFDLLFLDGKDLRDLPLRTRKKLLKKVLPKRAHVRISEHVPEKGIEYFEAVAKQGLEGVIAKRADSPYLSGTRSDDWLKIKAASMREEAVVIGYTEPRQSRKYIGSLILAVRDGENLRYAGHTGGSMGGKSLKELYDALQPLRTAHKPADVPKEVERSATWVTPRLGVVVKFTEWTENGTMRHPLVESFRDWETRSGEGPRAARARGLRQAFSNRSKVFWPREGYTKGDVIDYYDRIADTILPYLKDRPMVLNRHPSGITKSGFYQKNTKDLHLPDFVETAMVYSESNDEELRYILCNNKETLLYLANLGCIEMNPWNSRIGSLDRPDYFVIDLDPGDNTFDEIIKVASVVREVLSHARIPGYPKTSGKTGLHLYVPLDAKYPYEQVRQFAELLVRIAHARIPEITSIERMPQRRTDKIYLDWLQNRIGQTLAAPYSLRPVAGALVSAPLEWSEVKIGLDPARFTIKTIFDRLKKKDDPFKPILEKGVDLLQAVKRLEKKA